MTATPLERAVSLSQSMLETAARADWDDFAQLEQQREDLLAQAFQSGERDEATLRTLIDCNRELCEEVARARDKVALEWQQAKGRSQAIAAYSHN
ncbi:protein FliT [Dyella sp. OK004]|uniref:flagellar protein FliT n=1 Tax=Dyella sp. OK004 TaxID=1855292 RepID=UPI0008ED728E|nr:flagellar protein FliT [Dyella sp. OK004]SFR87003.1 protein FliT [Dyella sp. OK004]